MARASDFRIENLVYPGYRPSLPAWEFHRSEARYRFLIWGSRSGKTQAGAPEFARMVLGSRPGSLSWIIAPHYALLQEAERQFLEVLESISYKGGLLRSHNSHQHTMQLVGKRRVDGKSADRPDTLRAVTLDGGAWADEAAFLKPEAHYRIRTRISASGTRVIYTTTPNGREYVYDEAQKGGLTLETPYGETQRWTPDGGYFVSWRPSWYFPWVPRTEIKGLKKTLPKLDFDREFGALFTATGNRAFHNIEDVLTREIPPTGKDIPAPVIGVDLARHHDWTFAVVMNGDGRVISLKRWQDVEWGVQRFRIAGLAKQWENAAIVIDSSNIGSVIEEDLRNAGLVVYPVDMSSPAVKDELVQSLQLGIERRAIKLPHPRAPWAPPAAAQLYQELCAYEIGITPGGRPTYNAPKGLFDDGVAALCLAYWGKRRGLAGAGGMGAAYAVGMEHWDKVLAGGQESEEKETVFEPMKLRSPRPGIFGNVFGRRCSRVGFESIEGPFWRG